MPVQLSLSLLLLILTLPASASSLFTMELTAGLGGQAVAGETSELKIRLYSDIPITGKLEIKDAIGLTTIAIALDEHSEKDLWLPVVPEPLEPIEVRLLTRQGMETYQTITFERSKALLTIVSLSSPFAYAADRYQQSNSINPVILSFRGLPHNSQAYSGIEAIVTEQKNLSSLDRSQYHALASYLGQCGILIISVTDANILQRLKNLSGCNGRFIHSFDTLSQVTPLLLKLRSEQPPKAPGLQDMLSLSGAELQHQMMMPVFLYLTGYVLFTALIIWRMKHTVYLLLLPILFSGAGVLAWTGNGTYRLTTWAETESDNNHIRNSSLLMLGGNRLGDNHIELEPVTRLIHVEQKSQHPNIRIHQHEFKQRLYSHTQLLAPEIFHLVSAQKASLPFSIKLTNDYPQVVLQQEHFSTETRLLWRGKSYKLPMLKKGDVWQPDSTMGNVPATNAERLLNRRLTFGHPALLMPLPAELSGAFADSQGTGWLIIRHNYGPSS